VTGDLDVLVVGGTGVDHIVRVPLLPLPVRDSLTVPPIQSVVGHTGTGVALGCAALGLRTALVDVIGDDMEGRLVQDRFASAGVELATATHPSGTRRAVNLVTPDGSRMSLYDPRPPVDLAGDRTLWSRLVDRTTSTDLHDWDGANPHHRPFALGADLVFLSGAALGHPAAEPLPECPLGFGSLHDLDPTGALGAGPYGRGGLGGRFARPLPVGYISQASMRAGASRGGVRPRPSGPSPPRRVVTDEDLS